MTRTRLWISAAIIASVVLVTFALSVPHTRDVVGKKPPVVTSVPSVGLRDVFKKGMHTFKGTVTAPNACTPVGVTASLVGDASSTQSILLAITLETDPNICLQLPTAVDFETTLAAPAGLTIETRVNGTLASTSPS